MKKTFLRKMIIIILIFCMCTVHGDVFLLSNVKRVAADVTPPVSKPYYDEEGEYRFRYYKNEVHYVIQINIEELEWLSAPGTLEKLYSENGPIYVEIFAYRKGYVIPKEFINTMNMLRCNAYCFVQIGEEEYDWGIAPTMYYTKQDFSPYVTFSVPDRYAGAYGENTKYVQLQTRYNPEESGFQAMISISSFCVGGKKYKTSDYFRDFFQYYSVDDILEINDVWRNYGYSLRESFLYPEEIGYFHMTEFGDDGVKKRHWKEYNWTYRVNTVDPDFTFANLEIHQMNYLEGGTFVLSDAAPISNAAQSTSTPSPTPDLTASEAPSGTSTPTDSPVPKETLGPTDAPDLTETPTSSDSPEPTATSNPSNTPQSTESPTSNEPSQPTGSPTSNETSQPMGSAVPSATLPSAESPAPTLSASHTPSPKQDISESQIGSLKKLTGTVTRDNKIQLKWSSRIPKGASKLVLYRKVSGRQSYVRIKDLSLSKRKYLDKKASEGKKYTYKLLCVDSSGKYMKSMKAVSSTISVPYFVAPKMKLTTVSQNGKRYLKIKISSYRGKYAEIYLSQDGKTYKKVPLKKLSISQYNGQFLLSYQKSMGQVYCKMRTWAMKKGKKRYSQYSVVKKIRLD